MLAQIDDMNPFRLPYSDNEDYSIYVYIWNML